MNRRRQPVAADPLELLRQGDWTVVVAPPGETTVSFAARLKPGTKWDDLRDKPYWFPADATQRVDVTLRNWMHVVPVPAHMAGPSAPEPQERPLDWPKAVQLSHMVGLLGRAEHEDQAHMLALGLGFYLYEIPLPGLAGFDAEHRYVAKTPDFPDLYLPTLVLGLLRPGF